MQNPFRRNPRAQVCFSALLFSLGCAPPPITWNQTDAATSATAAETQMSHTLPTVARQLPSGSTR